MVMQASLTYTSEAGITSYREVKCCLKNVLLILPWSSVLFFQSLFPTSHAYLQSAMFLVSGTPSPCCVPEKQSALRVLYQESPHVSVLRYFQDMRVESCSCRWCSFSLESLNEYYWIEVWFSNARPFCDVEFWQICIYRHFWDRAPIG